MRAWDWVRAAFIILVLAVTGLFVWEVWGAYRSIAETLHALHV